MHAVSALPCSYGGPGYLEVHSALPLTKDLLIRCATCSVQHTLSICCCAPAAVELDADRAELFRGASVARSGAKGNSIAPRSAADIKAAYGRNNAAK